MITVLEAVNSLLQLPSPVITVLEAVNSLYYSYRLQSLLCLKLFQLKKAEASRLKLIMDDYYRVCVN